MRLDSVGMKVLGCILVLVGLTFALACIGGGDGDSTYDEDEAEVPGGGDGSSESLVDWYFPSSLTVHAYIVSGVPSPEGHAVYLYDADGNLARSSETGSDGSVTFLNVDSDLADSPISDTASSYPISTVRVRYYWSANPLPGESIYSDFGIPYQRTADGSYEISITCGGGGDETGTAPSVSVTFPSDGFSFPSRIVAVTGEVDDTSVGTVEISVNGRTQTANVSTSTGSFSEEVVLTSGGNTIKVSATNSYGTRSSQVTGTCTAPPTELWVQLTWSEDHADADLYVTEPNGETAWYGDKTNSSGGFLDLDDTDGYGPEHYYISSEEGHSVDSGNYTIRVHYYASHGHSGSVRAKVVVYRNETHYGTYGSHSISTADSSSSGPGGWEENPAAWWTVVTVPVQ